MTRFFVIAIQTLLVMKLIIEILRPNTAGIVMYILLLTVWTIGAQLCWNEDKKEINTTDKK